MTLAMQFSLGVGQIAVLVGAGYAGAVFLKSTKVAGILDEFRAVAKELKQSAQVISESTQVLSKPAQEISQSAQSLSQSAQAVSRSAKVISQSANRKQITVLNDSSSDDIGITVLIIPAVALGALGCGYMLGRGISISAAMDVPKRNMAAAVATLTKKMHSLNDALQGLISEIKGDIAATVNYIAEKWERAHDDLECSIDEITRSIAGSLQEAVEKAKKNFENPEVKINEKELSNCMNQVHGEVEKVNKKMKFMADAIRELQSRSVNVSLEKLLLSSVNTNTQEREECEECNRSGPKPVSVQFDTGDLIRVDGLTLAKWLKSRGFDIGSGHK